jgi:hypothetical protein
LWKTKTHLTILWLVWRGRSIDAHSDLWMIKCRASRYQRYKTLFLIEKHFKSNFVTCAEYKCRLYCESSTYKPLTNSAVQEELRKYLPSRLK